MKTTESKAADACRLALMAMGRAGANADVDHPLRKAWEACREVVTHEQPTGARMDDDTRSFIEGMSVSVDVSTGENDAGHRLFGTVSEAMDDSTSKHGVVLLVHDLESNFDATPVFIVDHVGSSYGPGPEHPTVVVGHSANTEVLKKGTKLYAHQRN